MVRPAWKYLEEEILPQIINQIQPQQQLRVWVSACATGEERQLNIRKFTPAATRAINIRANDIERSLAHFTHNLNCPNLIEILQKVVETGISTEREVCISQTREKLLMRVNLYLREDGRNDGIVLTFVNINELKKVQQQLHQANALLENLYLTSPVGLSLHDQNLKYLRVNQTLADINGISIAEHIGKTVTEISSELGEKIESSLRRVIDTNRAICDVEITGSTSDKPDIETHILHLAQKPGLLRVLNRENPSFSFINPVSLCLLIMVQDMRKDVGRLVIIR